MILIAMKEIQMIGKDCKKLMLILEDRKTTMDSKIILTTEDRILAILIKVILKDKVIMLKDKAVVKIVEFMSTTYTFQ